ncbi:AAA family ATPase [Vibrio alginolyticus]|nr:AAA family ATPase [Vibrio alginolyticus]
MLEKIEIANFKSIEELSIDVGVVNVFIGENGSGKSSILEALVMAALADSDKLDDDLLESRGVRTTTPHLMKSIFDKESQSKPININIYGSFEQKKFVRDFEISYTNENYADWSLKRATFSCNEEGADRTFKMEAAIPMMRMAGKILEEFDSIKEMQESIDEALEDESLKKEENTGVLNFTHLLKSIVNDEESLSMTMKAYERTDTFENEINSLFNGLKNFAIYSPQNEQLRDLVRESRLKPLGIYGEGLFKLLNIIHEEEKEAYKDLIKGLNLIGWFDSIKLPKSLGANGDELKIKDRYLHAPFNLRSTNEGFLYILFYMALIVSKDTPKSFAIDNIDAALNPKLCSKIMEYIAELASKYGKQIFLTTQNSAVLDGLNLSNDDQRLFVVSRPTKGKYSGRTKVKRLNQKDKPKDIDGNPIPLSEAMLRGYIGGIPKGF